MSLNPPGASNFGGAWKSLVKSAKRAWVAFLNNQTLNDKVCVTALVPVENLLNGLPLTYISGDSSAEEVLKLNHLLVERAIPNMPPDVFDSCDMISKMRWCFSQALAIEFWTRWMSSSPPWKSGRSELNAPRICTLEILSWRTPKPSWTLTAWKNPQDLRGN